MFLKDQNFVKSLFLVFSLVGSALLLGGALSGCSPDRVVDKQGETGKEDPEEDLNLCGNNIIDMGEICDGINLNSQDCETLGFENGQLMCYDDCTGFDLKECISFEEEMCKELNETCSETNKCCENLMCREGSCQTQ